MKRFTPFFLGFLGLFLLGWLGMVNYPYTAFAELRPDRDATTNEVTPPGLPGTAVQGVRVYAANGCVECHSQFVRDKNQGSDIDRKWGARRTVARDYMNEGDIYLGTSRLGPDLTNVAVRQKDPAWYYQLLYDPASLNPESGMPAYRWLFKTRKIAGQVSEEALKLNGKDAPAPGYEVVPTNEAKVLVAYLLALKRNYPLPEAPEPKE
ncbi:MAG TPA: cbb3-type cytochrome c oxidase subunit II [Chthoniobacterales bacterium]